MGQYSAMWFLCISSVLFAVSESRAVTKVQPMLFRNFHFMKEKCPVCPSGTVCFTCGMMILKKSKCVKAAAADPFKQVGTSLPFNKYSFLTTHNSFAINGESLKTGIRITLMNQDKNITQQLQSGVRALMLDTYDFQGGIWLCHSRGGKCKDHTSFEPAQDTLKEISAFLSANPSEIVTLILEDYVTSLNGLTNIFKETGLMKYWFPLSKMPRNGGDWPLVKDMIAANQRLIVFTSKNTKEKSEGIAYQWNFMVENQYGNGGLHRGKCPKRSNGSANLNDKSKTLVLINYFPTIPFKAISCMYSSKKLMDMLRTCHGEAGQRWANFIAVDYFERIDSGGAFEALDMLNGQLLCGKNNIHQCPKVS